MVPVPTPVFRAKPPPGSEAWLEYGATDPIPRPGRVPAATPHCTFDPTGPGCCCRLPSPPAGRSTACFSPRVWGTHVGAVVMRAQAVEGLMQCLWCCLASRPWTRSGGGARGRDWASEARSPPLGTPLPTPPHPPPPGLCSRLQRFPVALEPGVYAAWLRW